MDVRWLDDDERTAWVRLAAVLELLPGVLDSQLRRDAQLTHFEYFVLAMLSEAPDRTLRMTHLAGQTNATLPRLSHVVKRLEERGLVERVPCPEDARATNARLTRRGMGQGPRDRAGPRGDRAGERDRRPDPRAGRPARGHRRRDPRPGRSGATGGLRPARVTTTAGVRFR